MFLELSTIIDPNRRFSTAGPYCSGNLDRKLTEDLMLAINRGMLF